MSVIRESMDLYKSKFLTILLIGLTITIPTLFLYTFVVNYTTFPLRVFFIPIWPDMVKLFFTMIVFPFIQIPFVSMALQYARIGDVKVSRVYGDILKYGFSIYVISILSSVLITIGSLLLLIPGLVLMIFFMGIPFVAVVDDMTGWRGVKQSFAFAKTHFIQLMGWLLLFVLFDFVLSFILSFIAIYTANSFLVVNLSLTLGTILTLPVFVFGITFQYLDWIGDNPVNDPAEDFGEVSFS